MTGCCAKNCHNRAEQGFRLFKFPSDELRKELWSRQCGKHPKEHSRLCEYHFDDSQFENSRQDGWRKLKPNAIPTIFFKEENIEKETKSPQLFSFQENLDDETINYIHYQCPFLTENQATQMKENPNVTLKTTYDSNENETVRQANEIKYLRKENNSLRTRLGKEKRLRIKYQKCIRAYRNLKNKYLIQSKKLDDLQRAKRHHVTTIIIQNKLPNYQPALSKTLNSDSRWASDHCYAKR